MGIEITEDGPLGSRKIRYENIHRAWLVKRYADSMELNFDPDLFFKLNRNCSDGEFYMVLFLLNVWNPSYAATKKHKFDLFAALNSLDEGNRQAICDWLQHPIWP